jgi:signal transduction histidine kinase
MLDPTPPDSATSHGLSLPRSTPDLGRVRAVIDALPEAVLLMDADGRLRLTNPAADHLFASRPIHDRADLLSRFEVVDGPREHGVLPADLPPPSTSITVRRRDQPNRWYALRTVDLGAEPEPAGPLGSPGRADSQEVGSERRPDRPGSRDAAELVAQDRRRMDRRRRESPRVDPTVREPDRGVGTEAEPLGATAVVLRDVTDTPEIEAEREAFLSVLSHELRTPITTIYAGSTVLARRRALDPPESELLARDIRAEAARLYDLVEDLLVLARLERGVLQLADEPVLLHRAVDGAIRTARERQAATVVVRAGVPVAPAVRGDGTYVEQACRNLVLAGVRFSGPETADGLRVDVRVDRAGETVACAVLDRGPSFSATELEHTFDLPDGSGTGRLAGVGIGLFICRHLVEAMGGRTWARNRPDGTGAELGFELPVHEAV